VINIFQWIYNLISSPPFLSILILLIATIVIILHRWRSGIIFIFIWLYLEDIIRKLLPGQPPQVMLVKDGLLLLTYFAFFATLIIKQSNKNLFIPWKPPFLIGLLIFAGWCIVEAFNPILPTPLFAAIGLRSYLWYMPLLFLGYYMFQKQENLIKFCRILVYTSIPLAVIAILQYIFYDFVFLLIRPFEKAHQLHSFTYENIKLIPSVFGSAERHARFAFLLFLLGLGLWFYPRNSSKQKLLIIISVMCAALGVFISGRRTPMYLLAFGTLGYILFYHRGFLPKSQRPQKSLLKPLATLLMVVFIILYLGFKDIGRYFVYSTGELLPERPLTLIQDMLFAVGNSGFMGFGTGSRSQGLQYIPGGTEWALRGGPEQMSWGVEGGIAKIWYELGPIGALTFIFFFAHMFLSWLKELRKLKENILYSLGFSICLFLIFMVFWFVKGHQIFGDATTLVCFWFFMGVLFRLKNLNETNSRQPA
jgi:hypothetical protein